MDNGVPDAQPPICIENMGVVPIVTRQRLREAGIFPAYRASGDQGLEADELVHEALGSIQVLLQFAKATFPIYF